MQPVTFADLRPYQRQVLFPHVPEVVPFFGDDQIEQKQENMYQEDIAHNQEDVVSSPENLFAEQAQPFDQSTVTQQPIQENTPIEQHAAVQEVQQNDDRAVVDNHTDSQPKQDVTVSVADIFSPESEQKIVQESQPHVEENHDISALSQEPLLVRTPAEDPLELQAHQEVQTPPETVEEGNGPIVLDTLLSGLESKRMQKPVSPLEGILDTSSFSPQAPALPSFDTKRLIGGVFLVLGVIVLALLAYFYLKTTNPLLFESSSEGSDTIETASQQSGDGIVSSNPSLADSLRDGGGLSGDMGSGDEEKIVADPNQVADPNPISVPLDVLAVSPITGTGDAEKTVSLLTILDAMDDVLDIVIADESRDQKDRSIAKILTKNVYSIRKMIDENPDSLDRDQLASSLKKIQDIYLANVKEIK